jgi:hypothetical protein
MTKLLVTATKKATFIHDDVAMTRSNPKSTATIMNRVARFSLLMMVVEIRLLPGKTVAKMAVTV